MRLLKLSANKPSFRTVHFRPQGLSLVIAEESQDDTSQTATYNGVGKSLMFALIHYCLGANRNKEFAMHLKGWVFSLTIDLDGVSHVITRSAEKSSNITLDNEAITLTGLKRFLQGACFDIPKTIKALSFRSLISRFIRSGRNAYIDFSYTDDGEQKKPYQAMLRAAFLLGLDLQLAQTKHDLRKREDELKDTMALLKRDPLFAPLLVDNTVDIELDSLRSNATKLRHDLDSFRVAEDYHDIELEADSVKRQLDKARRQSIKITEAISQIDRSLESKGDIPPDRIFALYAEARIALPELLQRQITDIVAFQKELQQKRVYRLTKERQGLRKELAAAIDSIAQLSNTLNKKLQYLNEHRALDEYTAVNARLSETNEQIAKLVESKRIRDSVDRELKTISRDLAEGNIETDQFLDAAHELVDEASALFRGFATELYGSRASGLSVSNDSGENQLRYKIDAHIRADAAEGINEAKIFCFDATVLALGRGHHLKFLAHDSTLFSPIDPRQRLAIFRIANRLCEEDGFQYIAALNRHDISSISSQTDISDEEFDQLFGDQTRVLTLTDESPSNKLLGIDIDMNYTK